MQAHLGLQEGTRLILGQGTDRCRRVGRHCSPSALQEPQDRPTSSLPSPSQRSTKGGDLDRHREQVSGLRLQKVEKLDKHVVAGVAAIERGGDIGNEFNFARLALLLGGDVAMLLLFAAIGKVSHGRPLDLAGCAETAQPLLIAWVGASIPLGAYSAKIQTAPVKESAISALQTWAVAIPAGILLRSIERNAIPSKSFVLVTLASTLVLLVGWRCAYALATQQVLGPADSSRGRGQADRKGNPLEFLQLLTSLTKRW